MLTRRTLVFGLFLALIFGGGVARLFVLRFEKGDIYPSYSSLRTDPLGGKAWYDSLDRIENLDVTRNYRSLHLLPKSGHPVIFYLGMPTRYFSHEVDLNDLDEQVRAGARLILAFQPQASPEALQEEPVPKKEKAKPVKPGEKIDPAAPDETPDPKLSRWQVRLVPLKELAPAVTKVPGLEKDLSVHSYTAFALDNPAWRIIYSTQGKEALDNRPILIERSYGQGSIVLCADSYLFSNEALRTERRPALLAWMLGSSRTMIFDETHFGITEQPGIATLARRYRLHGAFAVCVLLGILFVWRNTSPLVPPLRADSTDLAVSGHAAASGLTNLLRRALSPKSVVAACLEQWRKTPPRQIRPSELEIASALATDPAKSPLDRYRAISIILDIHARRP